MLAFDGGLVPCVRDVLFLVEAVCDVSLKNNNIPIAITTATFYLMLQF